MLATSTIGWYAKSNWETKRAGGGAAGALGLGRCIESDETGRRCFDLDQQALRGQARPLPCPRCGDAMQHLALAAHLGRMGQLDLCSGRRLVWFDSLESVNLASPGWVALLRKFQVDSSPALLDAKQVMLACPQCRSGLKTVHNRSRYGAFAALACPRGHGHLHTHTGALA